MIRALNALTLRGRGLVAVGLGLAVGATLSGQRDLLRVAILLVALPVISLIVAHRTGFRLGATRAVSPARIPVGTDATVDLTVRNVGRGRTSTLLLADQVPADLGADARVVLDRVEPGGARTARYSLQAQRRGRFTVGPLRVTAVDPFGLVRVTRAFRTGDPVLVIPAVVPLDSAALRADHLGRGDGSTATLSARGHDDVVPRDYRTGDDLRRIHWRATARTGDLMVRREEQPWTHHASVIVDLRAERHAGTGPTSSLEAALSATASIAVHLLRRGWRLRLMATDGRVLVSSTAGSDGEAAVLEQLALVEPVSGGRVRPVRDDLVIGILTPDIALGHDLGARGAGELGLALVVDTPEWGSCDADDTGQARIRLESTGWQTATLGWPVDLTRAWADLTRAADMAGVRR